MTPRMLERRYRSAAPFVTASVAVHVAAATAALARPRVWPWALGAVAANHLVLTAAGLWPRSRLLGPNLSHLPAASAARGEVAITIDDGPDPEVTPRVLALLAEYRAQATFFCVGERVERYAALAQEIVSRGHTVENHTQRHRLNFSLLGPRSMRREIARAQDSIAHVTGVPPKFFRAPAGLRNIFLDPVLRELQLRLASWTRRGFDAVHGDPEAVFGRLTKSLHGGDILLLHDGHAARSAAGEPIILAVLPRLLERLQSQGLTPVTLRACLAPR